MISAFKNLKARLRHLWQSEDGSPTVEFVLVFPVIMGLFFATAEFGLLMTRQSMLETAVDKTVRHLRLGHFASPDQDDLRRTICKYAAIIPDCRNSLLIELRPVSTVTWSPLSSDTTCKDRNSEISPVVSLNPGVQNEMVLVRVCAVFSPFFPTSALGMRLARDELGGYALVASSAFVNEPS